MDFAFVHMENIPGKRWDQGWLMMWYVKCFPPYLVMCQPLDVPLPGLEKKEGDRAEEDVWREQHQWPQNCSSPALSPSQHLLFCSALSLFQSKDREGGSSRGECVDGGEQLTTCCLATWYHINWAALPDITCVNNKDLKWGNCKPV